MAEFFDQICKIFAQNAEKHPGHLTADESVREFFQTVKKTETVTPSIQNVPVPPTPPAAQKTPQAASKPAAPAEKISASSLENIQQALINCQRCPLCSHRHNIVFGEGNPHARLMFIGEGPGYDEDMQGRPFVGKAGQLLDKMIAAMQFTRAEVYIANIVKCRPDGNRNPMPDEIAKCIPFLHKQIEIIRPEAIVCLGATAAKALLNTDNGISRLRGKWCSYQNIPVMPTFHPAFLLRQESAKREAWQDLKLVMARFGKLPR
jgi:DNA polymerase